MSIIFSSLNGAKRRAFFISLVVTLSLLAGMVGSYFASSFGFVLFGLGTVNEVTPDYNNKASVVIREAKNVVVMQNEQVQQTAASYQDNSLVIAKRIVKSQNPADKYYDLKKPFAEAMAVTSDGWLVTNLRGKLKKDIFKPVDYVILDRGKNQFNIDRVIKDDKNGLYFIHIKSSDLKVYKNNENAINSLGSLVVAANNEGIVLAANLSSVTNGSAFDFSDKADKQIVLNEKIDQNFSAILSLSSELVGFVNQDGQIVPANSIAASVNSILKFGAIKRPSLGVYCQDLNNLAAVDGKKVTIKGCLVFNGKDAAVVPGSPSDKAGIKNGDIITALNQEQVIGNLSDAILRFLPGDKITLTVDRAGKVQDVEIILL